MYCTNCGAQNIDTAKFCAKCGTELVKPIHPTQLITLDVAEPPAVSPWHKRRVILLGLGALILAGISVIVTFAVCQLCLTPCPQNQGKVEHTLSQTQR